MNRAELKSKAKIQIKGKIGILFVISLIIAVVSGVAGAILSLVPVVGSIAAAVIVTPAFALSTVRVYLMVMGGKTPDSKDAFCGFDDFWSAFKVTVLATAPKKIGKKNQIKYSDIERYISFHDDENGSIMKEYRARRNAKENGELYAENFFEIKKWFFEIFPEVA